MLTKVNTKFQKNRRWYYGITKGTKDNTNNERGSRISYWLINQLVRKKQIPCSKVGGKYLFRVQALDEYLKNMEQKSIS